MKDTINNIGLGMTLGGIITLLIMIPFLGNDKEALFVFPSIIIGTLMLCWNDNVEEKRVKSKIEATMDKINNNRDEISRLMKSDLPNVFKIEEVNKLHAQNNILIQTLQSD